MKSSDIFFKRGDIVRSRYRHRWIGVVTTVTPVYDKCKHVTCRIMVTHDKNGNPMRKREIHELDQRWLESASINDTWSKSELAFEVFK